jgi:hypothetical protein
MSLRVYHGSYIHASHIHPTTADYHVNQLTMAELSKHVVSRPIQAVVLLLFGNFS